MAFFFGTRRKRRPDLVDVNLGVVQRLQGYTAVWDERPVGTTPGTGNFAYETLQLPAFTPAGTGIVPFFGLGALFQPVYGYQTVPVQGVQRTAGQIVMQPLYNPNEG